MRFVSRRSLLLVLACCSASLALSCGVSPTLPPLPPPDEPQRFQSVGEGLVLIEGLIPIQEAKVFILNNNSQNISGQFVHDQRYAIEIEAASGDFLQLWYTEAGIESDAVGFEIPDQLE